MNESVNLACGIILKESRGETFVLDIRKAAWDGCNILSFILLCGRYVGGDIMSRGRGWVEVLRPDNVGEARGVGDAPIIQCLKKQGVLL